MILRPDTEECGILKIGDPPEELPGIINSVKLGGSLLFESAEIYGRSGTVKIVQGWDDADLAITLLLLDNPDKENPDKRKTRYDYLKVLTDTFRKVAKNGKPEIYTLSHPLVGAWGYARFLFSDISVTENRTKRMLTVSLEFLEYDNYNRVKQDRDSTKKSTQAGPVTPPVSDKDRAGLGKTEQRFVKQ
jgi:hypothetical protein